MDILEYGNTINPDWWLKRIAGSDWTAGQHLHELLKEGRFHSECGEKARLLLLTDGSRLAGFCVYAEKDGIPETELKPWLGYAYTDPDYRGRRLLGRLISRVKELAREDGYEAVYLTTGETGLYEKYGASFLTTLKDEKGADTRIYRMDTYGYYGWQQADVKARIRDYPGIETPGDLYNALWHVWSRETCTARMRAEWSEENRTLGQCTITAFLAQDIFGGQVYGVPLGDGNYHCFNVVGDCVFDLTSEQFGDEKLDYSLLYEQTREEHFRKQEKYERYEKLKAKLSEFIMHS